MRWPSRGWRHIRDELNEARVQYMQPEKSDILLRPFAAAIDPHERLVMVHVHLKSGTESRRPGHPPSIPLHKHANHLPPPISLWFSSPEKKITQPGPLGKSVAPVRGQPMDGAAGVIFCSFQSSVVQGS
jgi:hypothetical protein